MPPTNTSRLVALWRFDLSRGEWTRRPAVAVLQPAPGQQVSLRMPGGVPAPRTPDSLPPNATIAPNRTGSRPWETWSGSAWGPSPATCSIEAVLKRSPGGPSLEASHALRPARLLFTGAKRDAHTGLDLTDGSLLAATWIRRDGKWVAEDLIVVPAAGFSPVFQTLGVSCAHPVTGETYPDGAWACLDTPAGTFYHVCNNGTWQNTGEPCEFIAWA